MHRVAEKKLKYRLFNSLNTSYRNNGCGRMDWQFQRSVKVKCLRAQVTMK